MSDDARTKKSLFEKAIDENIEKNDLEEKIEAQDRYCEVNELPVFAPSNGLCYRCNRQIYSEISLERAKSEPVTSCPFCHRSYCD